ncbi:hypothetical protein Halha_1784 [Halobacteroides halobius DSM 5150]|uniref:Uncharacterized protein n=1 Tax=Halobacteroides halobius (strain ATCC 35273 / DSM 5150 / MD-1) TaxID=748449 RepID=L0KB08_HALHC|nr:pilus assembly PilX N-terminal domain-containing protein [Halobacteroides halobius]AGB41720.1 hypothetical protein Halha_1784 [Halobacteroides halobius DSM 5150]
MFTSEQGFTIYLSLLVITILMILVIGTSVLINNELKSVNHYQKNIQALYLAEAGIERSIDIINSQLKKGRLNLKHLPTVIRVEDEKINLSNIYDSKGNLKINSISKIGEVTKKITITVRITGSRNINSLKSLVTQHPRKNIIVGGESKIKSNGKKNNNLDELVTMATTIPRFNFDKYKAKAKQSNNIYNSNLLFNNRDIKGEIFYIKSDINVDLKNTTFSARAKEQPAILVVDGDLRITNANLHSSLENIYFIIKGEFLVNGSANKLVMNNCLVYAQEGIKLGGPTGKVNNITFNGLLLTPDDFIFYGNNPSISPRLPNYNRLYLAQEKVAIISWQED